MFANRTLLDPTLINTAGHCAGALLFGVVIALLIRDGWANPARRIRLSLIAAILAFGWNVGSLLVMGSSRPNSFFIAVTSTASFAILSLLPAVLFQVALQGRHKWLPTGGYAISAGAAFLHFREVFSGGGRLHQLALISIAVGFGVLTVSAIYIRARQTTRFWSQPAEWLPLAFLSLFTTSFLHFGYEHASSPWSAEITWHHLGIPVALILLLQDYRFLLLDTFIRFLVNSCLAGLYVGSLIVLNEHFGLFPIIRSSNFLIGLSLVGLCFSLILFAWFRNGVQSWIGRVVFRRKDLDECISQIAQTASAAGSEEDLLEKCAANVARHLNAERYLVANEAIGPRATVKPSVLFREEASVQSTGTSFYPEAQIPLRFSSGDSRFLVLGYRHQGRRYLSEDLEDMRRLTSVIVEQVERFRADELRRLMNEAELRALQAQINPHFLFNALNTLYGTIDRHSQAARQLVLNLADIFRYVLQGNRALIPLGEELRIVQAYLEIEKVRLGDRLRVHVVVPESLQTCLIPVLSLQPLVENAIKHGIVPKPGPGEVSVTAQRLNGGVRIAVTDTGGGFQHLAGNVQTGAGMGLDNVRKRLAICFGSDSSLIIQSGGDFTTVMFDIPEKLLPDSAVQDGASVSAHDLSSPAHVA